MYLGEAGPIYKISFFPIKLAAQLSRDAQTTEMVSKVVASIGFLIFRAKFLLLTSASSFYDKIAIPLVIIVFI